MQPLLSFALIVRNEETKLPACLESIAGIANEIIVVDTGSTDRTKHVAAGLGAKVFDLGNESKGLPRLPCRPMLFITLNLRCAFDPQAGCDTFSERKL